MRIYADGRVKLVDDSMVWQLAYFARVQYSHTIQEDVARLRGTLVPYVYATGYNSDFAFQSNEVAK